MAEGESDDWSDDGDLFEDSKSKETPSKETSSKEPLSSGDSDSAEEDALPETPPIVDNVISAIEESTWGLPLRVAPVLKQFNAEEVSEYPLQQSVDGSKTTSLIVDDDLLRIIEARVDEFGQRRLNVSLTMNREITGFKHQHNGFLKQFEWVWIGSSIAGLLLLLISSPFLVKFLGITSALVGLILSVMTHLEIHRIEFSNNGGSHSRTLFGVRTNRPFFRASMALLGSEMAGLQRNGTLNTSIIEELHSTLALPPPVPEPTPEPLPIQQPPPPQNIPAPPQNIPPPPAEPQAGPPVSAPQPLPAPLPLPANPPMPQPVAMPVPPPPAALSSPAMLPPPAPLPPIGGAIPPPPPMAGPMAPVPLDAPLPNAPEIPVTASPVEDTLSKAEQNQLLNELS